MLAPDDLIALHEALRPPAGFRLDVAVGTTFSLDLLALLGPPVAFAMFDLQDADDPAQLGGLAVLESVRRYADAMTVFCQAGHIAVPSAYRQALTWTEGGVIEVRRPAPGRVFHPKSWTLRFTDEEAQFHHRVIVLSRNLTFDRSWDIVVTLDEDENSIPGAASKLSGFLRQLPGLAASPTSLSATRREVIEDLATTVAAAHLAPPKPFTSVDVWPLGGTADAGWPYPADPHRTVIISPFLNDSAIQRITKFDRASLISTSRAIDGLGPATVGGLDCWVLAETPTEGPAELPAEDADGSELSAPAGLHAKVVVSDTYSDPTASHWVAGSANATHNAHHGNVELVVRMTGPRHACGVAALLEPNPSDRDRSVLLDMIEQYTPGPDEGDAEAEETASALDAAMIDLATAGCVLNVGERSADGRFPLTALFPEVPSDFVLSCRPITYGPQMARTVDPTSGDAHWEAVTLEALTPYLVVTAEVLEPIAATRSRVLVADLVGAPLHRRERILAQMLKNADDFLRYLILLLGSAGDAEAWTTAFSSLVDPESSGGLGQGGGVDTAILETLLRTAAHQPQMLRHVEALVQDLRTAGVADEVIPPSFDAVWSALSAALPKPVQP